MTSYSTTRRHIAKAKQVRELHERANELSDRNDHFTATDRATSANLDAAEMLREFIATEI